MALRPVFFAHAMAVVRRQKQSGCACQSERTDFSQDRDEIFTTLAFCIALASLTCIAALYFYFHDYKTYRLSKLSLGVEIKRNRRLLSENFYLLNVDGLTGLPNRSYFFKSLTTFIADAKSAGLKLAVGMIDLNGFKAVNDLYGHGAGDAVLAELGSRLRKLNDQDVLIARLGGDEIGLVIGDASNNHTLQSTCEEIKEVFAKPFLLNNASAKISASIGFAMYPEAGNEANILLERADYAMYAAKKSGDHEVIFFSQSHQIDIQNKRKLHQALKDASLEDELQVFFQPIVHSETSKIVAFEALARWDSPVIGKVAPDRFIKAAEEINLIGKVTRVLFRKAVKAASLWPVEIELSFNLSAQDLMCGTIESELSGILKKYGFKPSRLILEVTETALLIDFEPAMKALQSLRESGIKIALDDFGTGYSSLGYIHKLPIDKIKIDKSFVKELGTNKKSQRILSSIILLSKNLELACVVEGIENEDQYQFLAHEGQLYLQGYRFGKPTPNPFSLLPTTAARPVVQTETAGL
ncbi:hypothetical protein Lal_00037118 [Lupinus albus]|nr:hypothetical protein Lal_00037118 [Lupinus albus]